MSFVNNPAVLKDGVTAGPRAKTTSKASQGDSPPATTQSTDVYFWYFEDAETESATPDYSQSMPNTRDEPVGAESVVNTIDGRTKVAAAHHSTSSGKYRAIVKLFLLYEGQVTNGVSPSEAAWAIATGWLVSGDVVVTAGHCAYDWSHSYGRLIKAKAYVGYGSSTVAFRYGTAVATTDGWINTPEGNEPSDLSFIKLQSKFTSNEVENFYQFAATPLWGKGVELGVVGYPGDIVNVNGERGAEMYEMFRPTDFDLASSKDHMLQYQIDTYGGNSGSPVFGSQVVGDGSDRVFGVHVLGGYSSNSASVFGGNYGNRAHAYYEIASQLTDDQHNPDGSKQPDKEHKKWLWKAPIVTTESDDDPMENQLVETITAAQTVTADIPKSVVDWDTPLSYGTEAGPRIAILSSAAISASGRLAADSVSGHNAELLGNTRPYDGVLGRAILAESALQYFLNLTPTDQKTHHESLGPIVAALKPLVTKIAPRILKGVLEPGMRLLLSTQVNEGTPKSKRDDRSTEAEIDTGFGRKLSEDEEKFLAELMDAVKNDPETVEGFFSTLSTVGDVIGGALKKAGPLLADVAKIGLPLLLGTESAVPPPTALDPLAHRAILAEACLQRFIEIKDQKARKKIYPTIVKVIKKFGPALARATPYVAKNVAPVVADILRDVSAKNKQEFLDFTWGNTGGH